MQLLCAPLLLVVAFGAGCVGFEIVGVAPESGLPLLEAGNDAGGPGSPLPRRDRCRAIVDATNGGPGQPGGHVVTGEIVIGEGEEREQRPTEERRVGGANRRAEPGDAGGIERIADQSGVRVAGAVQHGDAAERCAATGGVDHESERVADLVVGVGDAECVIGDGGYDGGATRPHTADRLDRSLNGRIGLR